MSAVIAIKMAPRRMLTLKEAAEYVGIKEKRFALECRVSPVEMPSGVLLYDIRDLDAWLDLLKTGCGQSDDEILSRLG